MRKYYLDNIRWATIVCVVIYHVFLIYSGVVPSMGTPFAPVQYQDGILYLVLHFGDNYADMPVMGSVPAVAFAWAAILAIFSGFKAWGDKTVTGN